VNFPDHEKIIIPNCVEISIRNGIVYVVYDDGAEVGRELKREMHVAFLKITGGTKMPFLFTNKGAYWIAKDARELARKLEPKQPFKAVAYWAPTLGIRLMAEFYGKYYKPEIPYKVFATEADALEWLKQYKD
jgi:hypothetical protein